MGNEILQQLEKIEKEQNVKILYAVEAGSRGWGFASKDSDYDARFIFIRPLESYLSIDDPKDYIELPINENLDINGWDIRKALKLFRKSNPPLLEWLSSPIVYIDCYGVADSLRALSREHFAPLPSLHHYLSLAKGTLKDIENNSKVKIKKYFYIIRPLLACMWIEKYSTVPPMEYSKLLEAQCLDSALSESLALLYEKKIAGVESDPEPVNTIIMNFFTDRIDYYEHYIKELDKTLQPDNMLLDELFRKTLKEVWSNPWLT